MQNELLSLPGSKHPFPIFIRTLLIELGQRMCSQWKSRLRGLSYKAASYKKPIVWHKTSARSRFVRFKKPQLLPLLQLVVKIVLQSSQIEFFGSFLFTRSITEKFN